MPAITHDLNAVRCKPMAIALHEEDEGFVELTSHYRLPEGLYDQSISDIHLEELSRSGCKQWKSLPSHLELETIVAEDIDKSQKNEGEKRHEFLLKWKDMKASTATYRQLITALLKVKCRRDAERVCEMLNQSQLESASSHHSGT